MSISNKIQNMKSLRMVDKNRQEDFNYLVTLTRRKQSAIINLKKNNKQNFEELVPQSKSSLNSNHQKISKRVGYEIKSPTQSENKKSLNKQSSNNSFTGDIPNSSRNSKKKKREEIFTTGLATSLLDIQI